MMVLRVIPLSCVVVVTAASVTLWEDKSLAGFMPLKAILVQPTITTDNGSQKVCSTFVAVLTHNRIPLSECCGLLLHVVLICMM